MAGSIDAVGKQQIPRYARNDKFLLRFFATLVPFLRYARNHKFLLGFLATLGMTILVASLRYARNDKFLLRFFLGVSVTPW